MKLTVDNFKNI